MTDHTPTTWPRGLQELAQRIGAKAAVALSEAIGGVETYIPKTPDPGHRLVAVVGLEVLQALVRHYGGQNLFIPRGVYRDLKKVKILEATGTRRSVALAAGVTERYVYRVRRDAKVSEDDPQARLF